MMNHLVSVSPFGKCELNDKIGNSLNAVCVG